MYYLKQKKIDLQDPQIENNLITFNFKEAIETHFKQINILEPSCWEIIGNGFSIDYYPNNEFSAHIMLDVYGENGLFELIHLAQKYNLQIYDSGIVRFLDINRPEDNGYERFNCYVRQILNQ